jgi:hypothetical protein
MIATTAKDIEIVRQPERDVCLRGSAGRGGPTCSMKGPQRLAFAVALAVGFVMAKGQPPVYPAFICRRYYAPTFGASMRTQPSWSETALHALRSQPVSLHTLDPQSIPCCTQLVRHRKMKGQCNCHFGVRRFHHLTKLREDSRAIGRWEYFDQGRSQPVSLE